MMAKKYSKTKKASLQLSVNFIVRFILAITVFSLGIFITYSIFEKVHSLKVGLDEELTAKIEQALLSGAKISIPIAGKDISKGDKDYFKIGIKNEDDLKDTFYVDITCDNAYTENKERICDEDYGISCSFCNDWFFSIDPFEIESNDREIRDIFVKVPKKSSDLSIQIEGGTYTFDVIVRNSKGQYDTLKKFYVTI